MLKRNRIITWRQGVFIDGPKYAHQSREWKAGANIAESFLVRPSPTGNAICKATDPETAAWIAERLNLAARLQAKYPKE